MMLHDKHLILTQVIRLPISEKNSVIPVVDDISLPIAQRKGASSCTHYPISDFVSYQHLSQSYCSFVSNLTSMSIPRNLREALKDPKWRIAMQEELFTKTRLGILLNYLMGRRLLDASGCSLSNIKPTVLWNEIRPDLLQKVLYKPMGLIMRKHLL